MAKNEKVFFTKEGYSKTVLLTNVAQTIHTIGVDGGKLLSLHLLTDWTGTLELSINNGGTDKQVGVFTNPIKMINQLTNSVFPKDRNGNNFINFEPGTEVKVKTNSSSLVVCVAYVEEY